MPELKWKLGYPLSLLTMAARRVPALPLLQAHRLALIAACAGALTPRPGATLTAMTIPLAHVAGTFSVLEALPPLIAALLYAKRASTLADRGRPVPVWRQLCFAAGLLTIGDRALLADRPPRRRAGDGAHGRAPADRRHRGAAAGAGADRAAAAAAARAAGAQAPAGSGQPAGRLPALGDRPLLLAHPRPLRLGLRRRGGARAGAHDVHLLPAV